MTNETTLAKNELIRVFKSLDKPLRAAGLRAGIERFNEFSNILFLKLLSEIHPSENSHWERLKQLPDDELISVLTNSIFKDIEQKYEKGIFAPTILENPRIFKQIIEKIDPLTFSTADSDIAGDAFEYFLKQTASTTNDLGEYFTPRHIVKTIINLAAPKFKEKIYDPFCGTGGFLTEAFNYIKANNIIEGEEDLKRLKRRTLYGSEITTTARIAKMNMILHGDGHSGITQTDSLANPRDGLYDIVLTNPPFSQSTECGNLYYNGLAKKRGDSVCVLHCLRALKKGGRMALIVPEGFLFRKDIAKVREFLLTNAKLQTIISLPQGTFLPYTGVKTNILYFTDVHKTNIQKNYWYFDVKNDGYSLNNNRRILKGKNDLHKVAESDLKKVEHDKSCRENILNIGFKSIDLDKVKKNNWNLVGSVYATIEQHSSFKTLSQLIEENIINVVKGKTITSSTIIAGNIPVIAGGKTSPYNHNKYNHLGNVITMSASGAGAGYIWHHDNPIWASDCTVLSSHNETVLLTKYLYYCLKAKQKEIYTHKHGSAQPHLYIRDIEYLQIDTPSLDEQERIVSELDYYFNYINTLANLVKDWKPILNFKVNRTIKIGSICNVLRGGSPRPINQYITDNKEGLPWIKIGDVKKGEKYITSTKQKIKREGLQKTKFLKKGSFILSNSMSFGRPYILQLDGCIHDGWLALENITPEINHDFLYYILLSEYVQLQFNNKATGSTVKNLNIDIVKHVSIPLIEIEKQEEIVKQLEGERKMIESQKDIIKLFQTKIDNKLSSLWDN